MSANQSDKDPLKTRKEPSEAVNGNCGADQSWFRVHYLGIPIPTYMWKRAADDFILLDFNEAAEKITNGKIAGFVGTKASEFFPASTGIVDDLRRCCSEKTVIRRELLYRFRSTGDERFLAVVYVFLSPDLIIAHTEDLTGLRRVEQNLRDSEERFRAVWERSPVGMCLTDRNGVYHYVNQAYCDIYGYQREELIGKSFFDVIIRPDRRHFDRQDYSRYFDNPESSQLYETDNFIRKDGTPVFVQYTYDFIRNDAEIALMVTINIDITGRKKAEDALRESEKRYRLLFDNAAEVIATIDRTGRFILLNKSAARYIGGAPEELSGKTLWDIFPQEQADRFFASVERVIDEGIPISSEGVILLPGNPRWFRSNLQPIVDPTTGAKAAFLIATDIDAEKQIGIRNDARYNLLERLRTAKDITSCLHYCCLAITEARLFGRAVLTLHNESREIINLGYAGLDDEAVIEASRAPAPSLELSRQMTREEFLIGHSYFIPVESGILDGAVSRYLPQQKIVDSGLYLWRLGDELFVPLPGAADKCQGWLSVDTPFDGMRPSPDIVIYLEELIDITAKYVHEIQAGENLERERRALEEKEIALREVLKHIREDKTEFRQRIGITADQVLIPALEKLVRKDGTVNKTYYNILRTTLPELAASSDMVTYKYAQLSPREQEICNFIRSGLSSKEISGALSITLATVKKHREQIRRKLGLKNRDINLTTYMRGLES
jgi:PAS domain S-box-containing protein